MLYIYIRINFLNQMADAHISEFRLSRFNALSDDEYVRFRVLYI